jgi:hypothetical protein
LIPATAIAFIIFLVLQASFCAETSEPLNLETFVEKSGLTPDQFQLLFNLESMPSLSGKIRDLSFHKLLNDYADDNKLNIFNKRLVARQAVANALQLTTAFQEASILATDQKEVQKNIEVAVANEAKDAAAIADEALSDLAANVYDQRLKMAARLLDPAKLMPQLQNQRAVQFLKMALSTNISLYLRDQFNSKTAEAAIGEQNFSAVLTNVSDFVASKQVDLEHLVQIATNLSIADVSVVALATIGPNFLNLERQVDKVGNAFASLQSSQQKIQNICESEIGRAKGNIEGIKQEFENRYIEHLKKPINQITHIADRVQHVDSQITSIKSVLNGQAAFPFENKLSETTRPVIRLIQAGDELGSAVEGMISGSRDYFSSMSESASALHQLGVSDAITSKINQVSRIGNQATQIYRALQGIQAAGFANILTGAANAWANPIGTIGSLCGLFHSGPDPEEARHKEIMDTLNLHTHLLEQILQNQAVMREQLSKIQQQLTVIDHKLDEQHVNVMRELFYTELSLDIIKDNVRTLMRKSLGLDSMLDFLDNIDTARNIEGLKHELDREKKHFEDGIQGLDAVGSANTGAGIDQICMAQATSKLRIATEVYPLLLTEIDAFSADNSWFSTGCLVSGSRDPEELFNRIKMGQGATNAKILPKIVLPADKLIDPAMVIMVSRTVRRFSTYEPFWDYTSKSFRFSIDGCLSSDAIGSMQQIHLHQKTRFEYLLRLVRSCLAQEHLCQGEWILPNLVNHLTNSNVQKLLGQTNSTILPELQFNARLYSVSERMRGRSSPLQYALAWERVSEPDWFAKVLGDPPIGFQLTNTAQEPKKWAFVCPTFMFNLPEPALVTAPKFKERPWIAELEKEELSLVTTLAMLELTSDSGQPDAYAKLATLLELSANP